MTFQKSKFVVLSRHIQLAVFKKESGPFWPRLLKEKTKVGSNVSTANLFMAKGSLGLAQVHWLKTDFDKWRDEDDSDVDESKDMAFEDVRHFCCCPELIVTLRYCNE